MTAFLVPALIPLGQDPLPSESEIGPGIVYPLVFGALVLVSVLLWVSMRHQLRKIDFDEDYPPAEPADDADLVDPADPVESAEPGAADDAEDDADRR
jgi:hypothetical protein